MIHDWDDEHLDILMRKVFAAIRPGKHWVHSREVPAQNRAFVLSSLKGRRLAASDIGLIVVVYQTFSN